MFSCVGILLRGLHLPDEVSHWARIGLLEAAEAEYLSFLAACVQSTPNPEFNPSSLMNLRWARPLPSRKLVLADAINTALPLVAKEIFIGRRLKKEWATMSLK